MEGLSREGEWERKLCSFCAQLRSPASLRAQPTSSEGQPELSFKDCILTIKFLKPPYGDMLIENTLPLYSIHFSYCSFGGKGNWTEAFKPGSMVIKKRDALVDGKIIYCEHWMKFPYLQTLHFKSLSLKKKTLLQNISNYQNFNFCSVCVVQNKCSDLKQLIQGYCTFNVLKEHIVFTIKCFSLQWNLNQ